MGFAARTLHVAADRVAWAERLDERTPTARVWQHYLDARRRFCTVRMSTHCFASPGSPWLDQVVDYRLRWTRDGWIPLASPYAVRIARKGEHLAIGGAEFELLEFGSLREGNWTALLPIRSEKLTLTARAAPFRIAPTWHASYIDGQIAPGVHFHAALSVRGYGKELKFARAVQTEYFARLADAEFFGFRYRMLGNLAAGWQMQTPRMYVRRRGGQAAGEYRRDGEFLYALFPRRELDRLLPGEWIVDPAITQERVPANSDDCYDRADTGANNLNGYGTPAADYAGAYGATTMGYGCRWTTIPVPQGSTLNSANWRAFRIGLAGSPNLLASCDAADNAATWTSGVTTNRPSGSGYTPTVTAAWTSGFGSNGAYTDVAGLNGMTSPVQAVVQRAGWASDNALRSALRWNSGAAGNWITLEDFNAASANEATLDIDYQSGAAGEVAPGASRLIYILP